MPNIVPRRDVQIAGRNFIAGSLYSVDEATVAAITEAEGGAAPAWVAVSEPEAFVVDEPQSNEPAAALADMEQPMYAALKSAWVEYAVWRGMSRGAAENATKAELIERWGY